MSLIEGIGDEVTFLALALFIIIVISLAWISTGVSDHPLIRIVVLDRARFQEFLHRFLQRNNAQAGSVQSSSPGQDTAENVTNSGEATIQASTGVSPENQEEKSLKTAVENTTDVSQNIDPSAKQENSADLTCPAPLVTPAVSPEESTDSAQCDQLLQQKETQQQQTSGSEKTATDQSSATHSSSPESPVSDESPEPLEEGHIRIRLKYLDERQRLVQARPEDTIGQFKRKHFSVELADNFTVRFIYRGQELREDRSTLEANRIEDNSVIHCLMSRITRSEQPAPQPQNMDIGYMMFPLFALILVLIWYCRFTYRSYFSAVSTLSLVGISFLFIVATLAYCRHGVEHEHED